MRPEMTPEDETEFIRDFAREAAYAVVAEGWAGHPGRADFASANRSGVCGS